jgi:hypothetical protein
MNIKLHRGMVLRHRTGRVYTVIEVANVAHSMPNHPPEAVLLGANGNVWTRLLSDFGPEKFSVIFDGTNTAPLSASQ